MNTIKSKNSNKSKFWEESGVFWSFLGTKIILASRAISVSIVNRPNVNRQSSIVKRQSSIVKRQTSIVNRQSPKFVERAASLQTLPARRNDHIADLKKTYIPISFWIENKYKQRRKTLFLGFSGGQGSGKTTVILSLVEKSCYMPKSQKEITQRGEPNRFVEWSLPYKMS